MADGVEHSQDPAHSNVRVGIVADDESLSEVRRLVVGGGTKEGI